MKVKTQAPVARKQTPIGYMLAPIGKELSIDLKRNAFKYIIVLPVLVWMALFCYKPMYGVIVAFENFRPRLGIENSEWIGLDNFVRFFNDPWFLRTLRNTLTMSALSIVFSFPVPIILALLLNEVHNDKFKRTVQTITYMPYFICLTLSQWLSPARWLPSLPRPTA